MIWKGTAEQEKWWRLQSCCKFTICQKQIGDLDTYAAATKLTLSTIVWDSSVKKSTPENGNGTNFENCLSIVVNMYSKMH